MTVTGTKVDPYFRGEGGAFEDLERDWCAECIAGADQRLITLARRFKGGRDSDLPETAYGPGILTTFHAEGHDWSQTRKRVMAKSPSEWRKA